MVTDRAPVGMLCRCNASANPHRHISDDWMMPDRGNGLLIPTWDSRAKWRTLARENHAAARAQLLKEIFG